MDKTDRALDVVARISGRSRDELTGEMELVADLGIDSPKALRLLADLEDELNIEISDEDAARMDTVEDVLMHVRGLS